MDAINIVTLHSSMERYNVFFFKRNVTLKDKDWFVSIIPSLDLCTEIKNKYPIGIYKGVIKYVCVYSTNTVKVNVSNAEVQCKDMEYPEMKI